LGNSSRKDRRLASAPVVVRAEVDRLLIQLAEKLHGNLLEARFRVAVGCRAVAVQGSKVSMAIDKGIAQAEVLSHSNQGIVDRQIAVRVILAQDIPHDAGTLEGPGGRPQVEVILHGVEDSP